MPTDHSAALHRRLVCFSALLVIVATVLMMATAQRAAAAPVGCGDVITKDTTLKADLLDCPGDGLVIGAAGITLDLGGHTISTTCPAEGCPGRVGIDNGGGYDGVRVRNGAVNGFEQGVLLDSADRSTVARLAVEGGGFGRLGSNSLVLTDSDDNVIKRSTLSGGDPALLISGSDRNIVKRSKITGGVEIRVGDGLVIKDGSSSNTVRRNTIGASGLAALVDSAERNTFALNTASSVVGGLYLFDASRTLIAGNDLASGQGFAIFGSQSADGTIRHNGLTGETQISGDRNLIEGNEVSGGALAIASGERNLVRGNSATGSFNVGDGILVEAAATITSVVANHAFGNFDDGIDVQAPGTFVRANTADGNGDLGIDAVPGTIDGGGNKASGNANPLQCAGVLCTP